METRQIIANQMALRQAFLSEKLVPSKVKEVTQVQINTKNNTICSSHIPANLERRVFTIPDLDTLKEIAGMPDALHQMNAVEWNQKVKGLSNKFDLDSLRKYYNDNQELVCKLMHQYVYGNSDEVKAYKELLARTYFPMEVAYYGNELTDLVVEKNTDCIIGEEGQASAVQFRKIILKEGARLVYEGIVDISANVLIQLGNASQSGNYVSIGEAGGNGGNGATGGNGANGAPTQNGSDGAAGSDGSNGQNGKSSNAVTAYIKEIPDGMIYVYSVGGNGGNGGNGGSGGNGGDGGDGKDEKNRHSGGNGGNGGKGGNGGSGGKAGDGAMICIYCNSPEKIKTIHFGAKGGNGGSGGRGGNAGKGGNGDGGSSGSSGKSGVSGKAGAAGSAGQEGPVNIFPYEEPSR